MHTDPVALCRLSAEKSGHNSRGRPGNSYISANITTKSRSHTTLGHSMDYLSQQRLSSILSASYSDAEIRNALQVLDSRFTANSPDSRRQLRVDVQAEVIQSNAHIVQEFAKIAEVASHISKHTCILFVLRVPAEIAFVYSN